MALTRCSGLTPCASFTVLNKCFLLSVNLTSPGETAASHPSYTGNSPALDRGVLKLPLVATD